MRRYKEPLNQYVYLTDLLDRNERLFYKLLSENVQELMPIVYTPTVGLACQKFGYTYTRPQVSNFQYKPQLTKQGNYQPCQSEIFLCFRGLKKI